MKLKLDDKGNVVVQDDKPVYVDDAGKDIVFDYTHTVGTIARLNGEAKSHREGKQALEDKLKAFEGIEDPEAARKALETVSSLNSGDLRKADEVEKIKREAEKAYKDKEAAVRKEFEPVIAERDGLKKALDNEVIGGAFSRSKFIAEKLAIPSDMVQSKFGSAFTLENGKITAKDADGAQIFSRAKPGEVADFDEAIEHLVEKYPHRDSILKSSGASGSGAVGSASNGSAKTISRPAFQALSPADRAERIKSGVQVTD